MNMMRSNSNSPIKDFDIMIVGGGPAGISTLLHLHKFTPELATRTILIEKEIYPRDKLCGGAVSGWSEIIFKNLGVNIDVPSVWIDNVEFRYGDNISSIHKPKFFRVVQRREFDHELANISIKRSLKLQEGEEFLNFVRSKDDLEVVTNRHRYKIKVLIGADGTLSNVQKKMSLPNKPRLMSTLEIFEPVNRKYDPEFDEKKVVFDFSPIKKGLQGYVWHFPCIRNNQSFINHGICDSHFYRNHPKANMKTIFSNELEKRHIKPNVKSWSGYPIRLLSDDDILSQPNILLAGDAAGIEPILGGGIHLALSYGELASSTIINAFKLNDFTFKDYKDRLNNHIIGKYIKKMNYFATNMYDNKISPIEVAKEIFSKTK